MRYQALLLAAMTIIAGPAARADGLDVKTGLWAISYTMQANGPMMPAAMLEKLTPEQRAKILTAAKQRSAARPDVSTSKSCVTAEDLKQSAFKGKDDDKDCTYTLTTHSSSLQQSHFVCKGEEARSGEMKIEALSREQIRGEMRMSTEGGKMSMQMSGKWLGANCAGADD